MSPKTSVLEPAFVTHALGVPSCFCPLKAILLTPSFLFLSSLTAPSSLPGVVFFALCSLKKSALFPC